MVDTRCRSSFDYPDSSRTGPKTLGAVFEEPPSRTIILRGTVSARGVVRTEGWRSVSRLPTLTTTLRSLVRNIRDLRVSQTLFIKKKGNLSRP